ncbi:hypothetical protein LP7551_02289 [Roseibium album]|nr:hypothetical protein LP7551_02289 [Roseibium album]
MTRLLLLVAYLCFSNVASAQEQGTPILRTSLEIDTTIPGQPLLYRVTLLVPTWMPKPPVFPSLEAPNVVVRLPPRASGPTSERINGETWSGISRLYRLYPMVPGVFVIPAGTIKVTYADPETSKPIETDVQTEIFSITGQVPPGAEELDPFLAAKSLKLDRKIDCETEGLSAGDALKITTRVSVSGVSPMFIPPIATDLNFDGFSVYSNEPLLEEKEDRGILSGDRTEVETIVAEFSGSYELPELLLSWYNLDSGQVETASVPAISFEITGVTPDLIQPAEPLDWRSLAIQALGIVVVLAILALAFRRLMRRLMRFLQHRRKLYRSSELFAFRQLQKKIWQRDFDAATRAGLEWQSRLNASDNTIDWTRFEMAVVELGATYYGTQSLSGTAEHNKHWRGLGLEVRRVRRQLRHNMKEKRAYVLPGLNPDSRPIS